MQVAFCTVEMTPLAKVGGLADVAGSLPKALRHRGIDVRVVMPRHRSVDLELLGARRVAGPVSLHRGCEATLWQAQVDGVPCYLIDCPPLFDREQVYGYPDDADRWLMFSDAILALLPRTGWQPDVLHVHDWHPAFCFTRLVAAEHPLAEAARAYTIHNLSIHGGFGQEFVRNYDLPDEAFPTDLPASPYSGMAQGILWADRITTVSPSYAREILTPEYGAGMDSLLRPRSDVLQGVLNGIDVDELDPDRDPALPSHYDVERWQRRRGNTVELRRRMGLAATDLPLVGMVSRLFPQKGVDLAAEAMRPMLAARRLQVVILGSGGEQDEALVRDLARDFPGYAAVETGFNAALAQLIYGGGDIFLMPSRFEPCGLGQMIAMRYGAVPVVRRTGGLADTVLDVNKDPTHGTGFVFDEATGDACRHALERALVAWGTPAWAEIVRSGMRRDFSWNNTAGTYAEMYAAAVSARGARAPR